MSDEQGTLERLEEDETLAGLLGGTGLDDDESNDPGEPSDPLIDKLRASGVDNATLEEVRAGTMLKADHTRKTQTLAEQRRYLEQQAQLFQLQQQYGGKAPVPANDRESPIKRALRELDPDGQNPDAQRQMERLLQAAKEEGVQETESRIAPVLQRQQVAQAQQWLDAQKTTFRDTFGAQATDKYWNDVVSVMMQYANAQQPVPSAVQVYWDSKPAEAIAVASQELKKKHSKHQEKAGQNALEGFTQQRRTKAPTGDGAKAPEPSDDEVAIRLFQGVQRRKGLIR